MTWLLYILVGVLAYSGYYTLSRVFLKQKTSDPVTYAILFNIVCTVLVGILALSQGFELVDVGRYLPNLLAMGVIYAFAQVFIFKASKLTEASEVIIISSTRIVWAIAAAVLLLGETFTIKKSLGAALVMMAVTLVAYKKTSKKKGKTSKDVSKGRLYALLAGAILGVGFVNDSYILQNSDATSYAAIVFFLPTILTIAIYRPSVKSLKKQINKRSIIQSSILGIFYAVGIVASYGAYQSGGDASQIVPMGQSVVVITVLLSIIFLSERDNLPRKILGSVIVTLGVILLT